MIIIIFTCLSYSGLLNTSSQPQIDQFLQGVFLHEIEDQCQMAIVAFANLKNGISSLDPYTCWGLVQIILASTANISKIFWPAYDKCRAEKDEEYALRAKQYSLRGKHLRELLSVDKRSPLNSRTLRNYQHYDENLHE
jgi:hypothetical protein